MDCYLMERRAVSKASANWLLRQLFLFIERHRYTREAYTNFWILIITCLSVEGWE